LVNDREAFTLKWKPRDSNPLSLLRDFYLPKFVSRI
jgi:hypothetical protein